MRFGISGKPIPPHLPFAAEITSACKPLDFPPCLAYAIKENETNLSCDADEMQIGSIGDFMPDGENAGHGPFQLTSSWPSDWDDPLANAVYALGVFLIPALDFWTTETDLQGEDLVRCIAVSFNAGIGAAWAAHLKYNVDLANRTAYGKRAVAAYRALIS